METRKADWTGIPLYAGIDVHKAKWVVTVRMKEVQLKTFVTTADKHALLASFHHLFPQATIRAVYEAGCFGYHLADFLNASGIQTMIVAPHTIPVAPGQFVKTDTLDSRKLAFELAKGALRGIYLRSAAELYDRALIRKRAQLVRRRIQLQNQIASDLRFFGKEGEVTFHAYWSRWLLADLTAMDFPSPEYRAAFQMFLEEYRTLRNQLRELDRLLAALAESDTYRERIVLLRTVPGVGRLSALWLLVELGDIHRFPTAERFVSYLGLSPSEYSSGETVRKGALTGMGHRSLRALLVQLAWQAIKRDPVLMTKFAHLSRGRKRTQAIIPVARSLACRIRHVLLTGEPYVIGVA